MANQKDQLVQVVGNLGGDPEEAETRKGDVVRISIAVTKQYDPEKTVWVRATSFNEGHQKFMMDKLYKGAKVAAEGYLTVSEYEGKPQHNLVITGIGTVEWAKGNKSKSTSRASKNEQPEAESELDW